MSSYITSMWPELFLFEGPLPSANKLCLKKVENNVNWPWWFNIIRVYTKECEWIPCNYDQLSLQFQHLPPLNKLLQQPWKPVSKGVCQSVILTLYWMSSKWQSFCQVHYYLLNIYLYVSAKFTMFFSTALTIMSTSETTTYSKTCKLLKAHLLIIIDSLRNDYLLNIYFHCDVLFLY